MSSLALLFLLMPQTAAPAAPPKAIPIEIELKKGSPEEARTRDQLQRLLREHDLERWIFTRKVVITGPPGGARDLESTYRHLIVCYWEIRAAKELLGELRGFQVGQYLAQDHYMWVYRKVMEEGYKIGPIIQKHGLIP